MLGRVEGRPLTTAGLRPGDRVGLTRWAGLEGTSILLDELGDRLRQVPGAGAFRPRQEVCPRVWLSVAAEALAAAAVPAVSCLHDVTEGGVGEAVSELERASGLEVDASPGRVPVQRETRALCAVLGMDPLGLIGSGALLVGCGEEGVGEVEAALAGLGVPLTWIGRAGLPGSAVSRLPRFPRDELLKLGLMSGVEAVIFDMDGTLVESDYDWPAIRRQLGIFDDSLIDGLNGLPAGEREARWRLMSDIEERATATATLKPGARELLVDLERLGLRTALVTNNTDANAASLLRRFDLRFEQVLTRDSGLWKPSAAPFEEAARRLGLEPAATLAVGDSRQDLSAARAAGCRAVCLLYGGAERWGREADLALPDLAALRRYLDLVLATA
jgi:HAD superfamily hydrolase (TIGR01509 family)